MRYLKCILVAGNCFLGVKTHLLTIFFCMVNLMPGIVSISPKLRRTGGDYNGIFNPN